MRLSIALKTKAMSVLLALLMCFSMLPLNVFAADDTPSYVALGDSISTGYGLTTPASEGFTYLLADAIGHQLTNLAKDGNTATGILTQLGTDQVKTAVKDAALITVTVGGNDLMAVLYEAIADQYNSTEAGKANPITAAQVPVLLTDADTDVLTRISLMSAALGVLNAEEDIYLINNPKFTEAVSAYIATLNQVMAAILAENADATIIVATQYNPYVEFKGYAASGTDLDPIYSGMEAGVAALNTAIKNNAATGGYIVADVKAAFDAYTGTEDLYNADPASLNIDFHPTAAGHAGIVDAMMAAAVETTVTLGAAALSDGGRNTQQWDRVYFGTYNGEPIKWRVLSKKGNKTASSEVPTFKTADQNEYTGDAMFLLSEYLLDTTPFETAWDSEDNDGQSAPDQWQRSDAQVWAKDFEASAFSKDERRYMLRTSKIEEPSWYIYNFTWDTANLNNDTVFFLSAYELSLYVSENIGELTTTYPDGTSGDSYWMRSPVVRSDSSAGIVDNLDQKIYMCRVRADYVSTRPAFNLDLSSVLFTAPAVGGKTVGDLGLNATYQHINNEYTLTMRDSSRGFAISDTAARVVSASTTVSLAYSGAATGTNEYLSAMIVDTDGEVLYYGQVAQANTKSGTLNITVPADIASGEYTLKVFNEQVNGDKQVDLASDFVDIPLTVANNNAKTHNYTIINGTSATGRTSGIGVKDLGVRIYADAPAEGYTFKEWKWSGVENLVFTNPAAAAADAATFVMPEADITVTAVYDKIPVLRAGDVSRTGDTTASVSFTSDEAGRYYYAVVDADAAAPDMDTTGEGEACGTSEQTVSVTTLTAGAKDVYIAVKDADGNVSKSLKITVPAYEPDKLATPTNPRWNGKVAEWDAVEGANIYQVVMIGVKDGQQMKSIQWSTGDTSHDFSEWIDDGDGIAYTFAVRAALSGNSASNSDFSATSAIYAQELLPRALTGTVTITGDMRVGGTLTATLTNGNNTGDLKYQWYRNVTSNAVIEGATGSSYTLTADDVGLRIYCVVSSTAQTGSITEYASDAVRMAHNVYFVLDTYLAEVPVDHGMSLVEMYPDMDPAALTPQKENHTFIGWYESTDGGETFKDTPYDFTSKVTEEITLYPRFARTAYTVDIGDCHYAGCSISGGGSYEPGATVTLTATPADGTKFEYWLDTSVPLSLEPTEAELRAAIVSYDATYTFEVTQDVSLEAVFSGSDEIGITPMLIAGTDEKSLLDAAWMDVEYDFGTVTPGDEPIELPGEVMDEIITVGDTQYRFAGFIFYGYDEATETETVELKETLTIGAMPLYGSAAYEDWLAPFSDGLFAAYMPYTPNDTQDPIAPETPEDPQIPGDPEKPDDPKKPDDPQKSEDPQTPDDPRQPTAPEAPEDPKNEKSPQLGDNSNLALWFALLFISGGAVHTLAVYDKKREMP